MNDPLETWTENRRNSAPTPPPSFTAEVMRQLRPPRRSAPPTAWIWWMSKAALFIAAVFVSAARGYGALFLILQS